MTTRLVRFLIRALGTIGLAAAIASAAPGSGSNQLEWATVANNADTLPGTEKTFNSYNPPSVNARGFVVFRARSRGPRPMSGIFSRDMSDPAGSMIQLFADRDTRVPAPNNTEYPPGGSLATFNEFPSFPRIGIDTDVVATRGNHQPVLTYTISGEDEETRIGTTGIYTNPDGALITGASLVGEVPGFGHFAVPGTDPPTRFEVFPGAPAITDEGIIVFKGNYTFGDAGYTGVFYRDLRAASGLSPVGQIANTETTIPNLPRGTAPTTFGSTAPPSAADGHAVFVGYDDEENPRYGGIYRAPLVPNPPLTILVDLESRVPVPGVKEGFTRIGEGLSYDGRFVGFWGAWGAETKTLRLYCPRTGNQDRRTYCNEDDPNSLGPPGARYQLKLVPVHQGIFVHDTVTGKTRLVAKAPEDFDDFLYWNYSGAPPGSGHGHGDAEPPRWRSGAFLAVEARAGASFQIAYKARTGRLDAQGVYSDPRDGIYLRQGPGNTKDLIAVETGMDGSLIDPYAINGPNPLRVTELAIERDALRGGRLAIAVGMGSEEAGWAGVYLTRIPGPGRR
jgi:hypothetical protein